MIFGYPILSLALSAKHCGKRGADVRPDLDKQPVRVMGYRLLMSWSRVLTTTDTMVAAGGG
jgi:hypothetical protein